MLTDSTTIKIDFLESLGCFEKGHKGQTLLEHLLGTKEILKKWVAPEYLQDAGLFHSVYGTAYFKPQMTVDRDKVRDLIGVQAEEIVFMFCSLPHPRTTNIGDLEEGQLKKDLQLLDLANSENQTAVTMNRLDYYKDV